MRYEKASAEVITFVNGCFITTSWGSSDGSPDSSPEGPSEEMRTSLHAAGRRHFPGRQ